MGELLLMKPRKYTEELVEPYVKHCLAVSIKKLRKPQKTSGLRLKFWTY
jgi:hypothetical protein